MMIQSFMGIMKNGVFRRSSSRAAMKVTPLHSLETMTLNLLMLKRSLTILKKELIPN